MATILSMGDPRPSLFTCRWATLAPLSSLVDGRQVKQLMETEERVREREQELGKQELRLQAAYTQANTTLAQANTTLKRHGHDQTRRRHGSPPRRRDGRVGNTEVNGYTS